MTPPPLSTKARGGKEPNLSKSREARSKTTAKSAGSRKKKKANKKKGERGFSVWRSVSLLPRISASSLVSALLILLSLAYLGLVVNHASQQLEINLSTQGVKRVYYAHKERFLPLEKDRSPQKVTVIDARPTPIWTEIGERFGYDIGSAPPFVTDKDPSINRGQWHTALRSRGIDYVETVGVGAAGEVSLIWPESPAPLPTLIVGHYYDQIAWIDPKIGVILSDIPSSWQKAPSIRLSPKLSRRW